RRVLALVLHGSGTVWGSVRVPTALAFSREAKVAGMRAKPVEMVANGDWLLFGKEALPASTCHSQKVACPPSRTTHNTKTIEATDEHGSKRIHTDQKYLSF